MTGPVETHEGLLGGAFLLCAIPRYNSVNSVTVY